MTKKNKPTKADPSKPPIEQNFNLAGRTALGRMKRATNLDEYNEVRRVCGLPLLTDLGNTKEED